MAEHHIGLDIGSFAVRAAEVSGEPGNLTLHRFAQLTLPPGAVVDGEIMDHAAVTAAIKSLWEKGGFKSKKVVVGMANRWVKVRETEVPALEPNEVRTSLKYEAQEVIPFAAEDTIVDYVVQDRYTGPDGGEFLRILVVAAQRQMVNTMLDTVRRAGLSPELVDLSPFALVRALVPVPQPGVSEAIVSIGAGLTNVVVHTGGTPRLVRMTPRASGDVTENLTRALGVDVDRAEALKRGAAVAVADPQTAQAADIIANELNPLVQEIQGSLDYFLAQTDDVELKRVLLTGAGAKMAGLRARLATELRVPVEMASPLEYLKLGRTGLSDEQLTAAAANLAAPVGLAMAPMATAATKLSALFPQEYHAAGIAERQRNVAIAAVAGFALLLGGVWVTRQAQVSSAQDEAQDAKTRADAVERQVVALAPFEQAAASIQQKSQQIQVALAADVDMVTVMDTFTAALPAETGITSIAITAGNPGGPGTPATGAVATLGTITISGSGISQDSTARWITAMRAVPIFSDVWVPSSSLGAGAGGGGVTFAGNLTLNQNAKSPRANNFRSTVQ